MLVVICAGVHGALVLLVLMGTCSALLLKNDSDGRALWYPDLLGVTVALCPVTEAGGSWCRPALPKGKIILGERRISHQGEWGGRSFLIHKLVRMARSQA